MEYYLNLLPSEVLSSSFQPTIIKYNRQDGLNNKIFILLEFLKWKTCDLGASRVRSREGFSSLLARGCLSSMTSHATGKGKSSTVPLLTRHKHHPKGPTLMIAPKTNCLLKAPHPNAGLRSQDFNV